jgi:uncharacterized membrane protein
LGGIHLHLLVIAYFSAFIVLLVVNMELLNATKGELERLKALFGLLFCIISIL